jgi:hypothetical protein
LSVKSNKILTIKNIPEKPDVIHLKYSEQVNIILFFSGFWTYLPQNKVPLETDISGLNAGMRFE